MIGKAPGKSPSSKARRGSPEDDGVATAFEAAGFRCCFDAAAEGRGVRRGWAPASPPPATHWTGTVVDYAYARGAVALDGCYVVPSGLSDHRPVICDWALEPSEPSACWGRGPAWGTAGWCDAL